MDELRSLLPLVKPYWRRSLLALLLLTVGVFMDLAIPRLIQRVIDQGVNTGDMQVVINTSLVMLAISAAGALAAIGNNYYSVQVGESTARDLRDKLFLQIQALSYGNLDRFTTGRLMVRLTSDASAVQRWVQITLRIGTRAPLLMLGSIVLMFITDARLALFMLPLLLITGGVIVWFSVQMEPRFRLMQYKLDRLNTVLQENIAGARLVKAFVRADYESERFDEANLDYSDRTIEVTRFMSVMGPILTIFVNIGIVIVIWAGGMQAIRGNLTDGQIVAFTNYLLTTMGPLLLMVMLSNVWANGIASTRRINEVLETTPEVLPPAQPRALPEPVRGQVVFDHAWFHYSTNEGDEEEGEEGDSGVLEDITFTAEPGTVTAILGATGSGKTSLINLIPRFYDVSAGRVLIDGVDVRDLDQAALLAHIGIAPQEAVLFSGTVRDNIRYGRPEASPAEVEAAAKAAQAYDFIQQLPEQFDTHIEERGVNLSGGQKQRIAIARALLVRPRILILDDSTSAVDVATETKIQAALEEIMRDRTSFIVAQRISTVLHADNILVLDRGRIAAAGSHAELMASSSIYREIYDSQLGGGLQFEPLPAYVRGVREEV